MTARSAIRSDAVWTADDIRDAAAWTYALSPDQQSLIVAAAHSADSRGIEPAQLCKEDFAIGHRVAAIDSWTRSLTHGRGFVLIKGFPVDELTPREIELAYVGLGLQLGSPVSQNAAASCSAVGSGFFLATSSIVAVIGLYPPRRALRLSVSGHKLR